MSIAIIKYNAGNVCSVDYALRRLGVEPVITADEETLRRADRVIFPGVGEAATTMSFLHASGLDRVIRTLHQPMLGICLGMQLMCRHSEEGDVDGLGIFEAEVRRFVSVRHEDKVPHMGWNTIGQTCSALFDGFEGEEHVYVLRETLPADGYVTAEEIRFLVRETDGLREVWIDQDGWKPQDDRCIVMKDGKIAKICTPIELFEGDLEEYSLQIPPFFEFAKKLKEGGLDIDLAKCLDVDSLAKQIQEAKR